MVDLRRLMKQSPTHDDRDGLMISSTLARWT